MKSFSANRSWCDRVIEAAAPAFADRIKTYDSEFEHVHINRGDGDGAYNL
jgi:hypothetical protein